MRAKYWLRLTGSILLIGAGGGVAMSLYMMLINSDMSLADIPQVLPMQVMMMGMLGCFIFGSTSFRCYVPMAVGFGCTRKEAWLGMQLMLIAAVLGLTVIIGALCLLLPGDLAEMMKHLLPAIAGVLLGLGSIGEIFGVLFDRFGKLGVVIGIFTGLFVGVGVALGMTFAIRAAETTLQLPFSFKNANIIVPSVGVLLWIAEMVIMRQLLRRFAVHF